HALSIVKPAHTAEILPVLTQVITQIYEQLQTLNTGSDWKTLFNYSVHPESKKAKNFNLYKIVQMIKLAQELVPNYTPAEALHFIPNLFDKIDKYNADATVVSDMVANPTDIKPDNIMLRWVDAFKKARRICFGKFDSDRNSPFPYRSDGQGMHEHMVECILYFFPFMDKPFDPVFRERFVARHSLDHLLDMMIIDQRDDNSDRRLIANHVFEKRDFSVNRRQISQEEDAQEELLFRFTALGDNTVTPSEKLLKSTPVEPHHQVFDWMDFPVKDHPGALADKYQTIDAIREEMLNNKNASLRSAQMKRHTAMAMYYLAALKQCAKDNHPNDERIYISDMLEAYPYIKNCCFGSIEMFFLQDKISALLEPFAKVVPYNKSTTKRYVFTSRKGEEFVSQTGSFSSKNYNFIRNAQIQSGSKSVLPSIEELSETCILPTGQNLRDHLAPFTLTRYECESHGTLTISKRNKEFIEQHNFGEIIKGKPKYLQVEKLRFYDRIGRELRNGNVTYIQTLIDDIHSESIILRKNSSEETDTASGDSPTGTQNSPEDEKFSLKKPQKLFLLAARTARAGAVHLLRCVEIISPNSPNKTMHIEINGCDEADRRTALHLLLVSHNLSTNPAKDVEDTLRELLVPTQIDVHAIDKAGFTPLMSLVDTADRNNVDFATKLITQLKEKRTNFNQRTKLGTALDFAVKKNNPLIFATLIKFGAEFLENVELAAQFVIDNKDNPAILAVKSILAAKNPQFAYEVAVLSISKVAEDKGIGFTVPFKGSQHKTRFFQKAIEAQLDDNSNNTLEGRHIVIPITDLSAPRVKGDTGFAAIDKLLAKPEELDHDTLT
ncbi:MAG: hypothetical protein M3R00_09810, partial [Pseudomonadota bacterium]|nr:hypothetical protein [Pseudomonadota bacterium]